MVSSPSPTHDSGRPKFFESAITALGREENS